MLEADRRATRKGSIRMKDLRASILALAICLAACNGQQGGNAQSSASAAAGTEAPSSAPAAAFTDIQNSDSAQAINDLAALGVLDQTSGAFRPDDPISRADFVRWLVKANNAIVKEADYHIHTAHGGPATFVDVPASDPDFGYIQGLSNAGYVIGVDATHFAPQKPLTREQMIYIKACLDEHGDIKTTGGALDYVRNTFNDASKMTYKFVGGIYEDRSAMTTTTFARVYGATKSFSPQQSVTRGEAAVALSMMRGEWVRSAAAALGRTPPPQ